jgi:uncharacterized protein (DUF1778 family)
MSRKTYAIRLSDEERAVIESAAPLAGESKISAFIRKAAVLAADTILTNQEGQEKAIFGNARLEWTDSSVPEREE